MVDNNSGSSVGSALNGCRSPHSLQERAWSSQIWYKPSAEALRNVKKSVTVTDLKKQGAVALTTEQTKALIAGKTIWFQNTVTGEEYEAIYTRSVKSPSSGPLTPVQPGYITSKFADNQGQVQYRNVGSKFQEPSLVGDIAEASYLGASRPYYINDGKIVTDLVGRPWRLRFTSWGTNIWACGATSSAMPTTS